MAIGDVIYRGASVWKRLVGNTTTTRKFLAQTGNGTDSAAPSWLQVSDADLSVTDVTTNNVTTSAHGFVPKAPNDTTKFLRGDATWDVPSGGSGGDTVAVKTADTTRNNVGGFGNEVADPHLVIAVGANDMWFFDVWLLLESASTAADWRFKFTVPSGGNIYHGPYHNGSVFVWTTTATGTTPQLLNEAANETFHGSRASGIYGGQFSGIYIGGSNAGNVTLAWCQATATSADSTLKIGSFIRGRKLN